MKQDRVGGDFDLKDLIWLCGGRSPLSPRFVMFEGDMLEGDRATKLPQMQLSS
ncbi:hypothetical protein H6F67_05710 [Microcoleus sp. FACHB-1515]|uniref:hypothetical protein n=1 Tax=Cyanophyceae TaxID=3028117 RepID=UPI0016874621|nr:hypothetical protein [Microcoleus sp. FACHB-1515]MBD2089347.1 hypothetical protein [Microcoleus sp. FACHB-1515]